jgi:hypothetical protein
MKITIDGYDFDADLETGKSPATCYAFKQVMPFASQVVHVRWSGEGMWIPLGDMDFAVGYEDATAYPAPGQILLYPKGKSETEILIAYGSVHFASKAGTLAGRHARRQPFRHDHVGSRAPARDWRQHAVARRQIHPLRGMICCATR